MLAMGALQQTGLNTGWLWYLIIGVLLLVVIIWWLMSRRPAERVEVSPEAQVRVREEKPLDDLTKIEGIGPKVARVLNEAGITTFEGLAQADVAAVQKTLNAAGLQMMNPEGWIEQANLAAKGDWSELERLQSELKGGRRK
jgi:LPXTG-motif cell wall-anchored protein